MERVIEEEIQSQMPTKRFYKIRPVPDDKIGDGIFEAEQGWEIYNVWVHPKSLITYVLLEKVEEV